MKVSVAIPAYNGEAFITEAVKSVLAQTFRDFELLVVDDCSTDKSLEIVRGFSDPRIRVVRNEQRQGIPGNWNRCVEQAVGEFICVFHQDDVMLPENLERKVALLTSDPSIGFVHSGAELQVEASAPIAPVDWIEKSLEDFVIDGRTYFLKLFFHGNIICAPTVVTRRETLRRLGGFDGALGFTSDYEMWMKVCVESRVGFLSQPLVRYRWHQSNASHDYRFGRGIEESISAGRRALHYYLEKTDHESEEPLLNEALDSMAQMKRWTATLEQGKEWLEKERADLQKSLLDQENHYGKTVADLENGKAWLQEDRANLQKAVEEHRATIGNFEKMVQEQKAWIHELETGKNWLAEQNEFWRNHTEERQARMESKLNQLERRFRMALVLVSTTIFLLSPLLYLFLSMLINRMK